MIEELVVYGASEIAGRMIDYAIKTGKDVRLQNYFKTFMRQYSQEQEKGIETPDLDRTFEKMKKIKGVDELLFEVYRKVCLSASRELGPKVMGMLSTTIINEERLATETEEKIFEACQLLNDIELREMVKVARSIRWLEDKKHGKMSFIKKIRMLNDRIGEKESELNVCKKKYEYVVELEARTLKSINGHLSPVKKPRVEEYLGRWAVKLRTLDIVKEQSVDRETLMLNKTSREFSVEFSVEFFDNICMLIDRATGPGESSN